MMGFISGVVPSDSFAQCSFLVDCSVHSKLSMKLRVYR